MNYKKQNIEYDLFVFTRPDLKFHMSLEEIYQLIDFDKFNIPVQHLSGNCDDNLFISNSQIYKEIHRDAFDNLIEDAIKFSKKGFMQKNVIKKDFALPSIFNEGVSVTQSEIKIKQFII